MPVPSSLADWSATESLNYPSGSDTASGVVDDAVRQIQATVRKSMASWATPQAASVLSLASADGRFISVTGSGATITSLGTVSAGMQFTLKMAGANTFVHSANIVCPGGTNIITAAGDILEFTSEGAGVWVLTDFQPGTTSVGGVPVGVIVPYGGSAAPSGWLLCYGQAVSRSTYAGLFATVSTTYGLGDGSTTFNIPDLRGRAPFGADNMGGTAASRVTTASGFTAGARGETGGAETVTLSTTQIPSHSHGQQGTFASGVQSADHTHTFSGTTATESQGHYHNFDGQSVLVGPFSQGGDGAIQSTAAAGTITNTGYNLQSHTHTYSGTTSGLSASHTHSTTISGTTGNTGSGGAHSNMPPALMTNYLIRV